MQRVTAAMIVALALCSLPTSHRSAHRPPRSTLSLELSLLDPAIENGAGAAVILKIGINEREPSSFGSQSFADLTQYFESLRESVMELLFKSRHLA